MAAISSSLAAAADGENFIAIDDIINIPMTKKVRNANTVPIPTSMSVMPWSNRDVSNETSDELMTTTDYTDSGL